MGEFETGEGSSGVLDERTSGEIQIRESELRPYAVEIGRNVAKKVVEYTPEGQYDEEFNGWRDEASQQMALALGSDITRAEVVDLEGKQVYRSALQNKLGEGIRSADVIVARRSGHGDYERKEAVNGDALLGALRSVVERKNPQAVAGLLREGADLLRPYEPGKEYEAKDRTRPFFLVVPKTVEAVVTAAKSAPRAPSNFYEDLLEAMAVEMRREMVARKDQKQSAMAEFRQRVSPEVAEIIERKMGTLR
jgi:hypothetical protein